MTTIALGQAQPLSAELEAVAADVLQGLQYAFVAAAAHPAVRLPFGSLEESFQDAIALRPAEQRWVYHSRARRIAMLPGGARQAAFGRFGRLPAEEFVRVGLAETCRRLPAARPAGGPRRLALVSTGPFAQPGVRALAPARTLALYITDVSCLDRAAEEPTGEEIAVGGLAIDASGGLAKVGRLLVRDDFEHGVRKAYGHPGRKFCEFQLPERLGEEPVVYGAAAFLEVADRAGFCEALAGAWARASPILKLAVESGASGAKSAAVSRAAGHVVERFVRWLGEAFGDDVFPPGLAFAGLRARISPRADAERWEGAGEPGHFTFSGRRGQYRLHAQWRLGGS